MRPPFIPSRPAYLPPAPQRKGRHIATRIAYDIDHRGLYVVPVGDVIVLSCGHPGNSRSLHKAQSCFECQQERGR